MYFSHYEEVSCGLNSRRKWRESYRQKIRWWTIQKIINSVTIIIFIDNSINLVKRRNCIVKIVFYNYCLDFCHRIVEAQRKSLSFAGVRKQLSTSRKENFVVSISCHNISTFVTMFKIIVMFQNESFFLRSWKLHSNFCKW